MIIPLFLLRKITSLNDFSILVNLVLETVFMLFFLSLQLLLTSNGNI